jgi:hypothetical protein
MMSQVRRAYKVSAVRPEGKKHLKYIGVDGRIILKWVFQEVKCGMD